MDEMDLMKKLRDVPSPSPEAYDRARGALHAAMGEQTAEVVRPKRWMSWPKVSVAALGAAAVVTAVVLGTAGGGAPATTPADTVADAGQAPQAVESPLVKLASEVKAAGTMPGDASLVIKRWTAPDGTPATHYTVYTDQGRIYYGDSPQTVGRSARIDEDQAGDFYPKGMEAARLAARGDVDEARKAMLAANGDSLNFGMTPEAADKAWKEAYERQSEVFRKIGREVPPFKPRPTGKEFDDLLNNHLWSNTTSVLFAGAANAEVRAGVLKLLATIQDVKIGETAIDGRQALTIAGSPDIHGGDGHEILTVDAANGLPISSEIVPNPASETPSKAAVVRYESSRVKLADVIAGKI